MTQVEVWYDENSIFWVVYSSLKRILSEYILDQKDLDSCCGNCEAMWNMILNFEKVPLSKGDWAWMQRPALEDGYIEHPWVTHQSSEFQRNMGPLPAEEVKKDIL